MNNIKEKLSKLHNTMCLVQTNGESTLVMAECISYVRNLITEAEAYEKGDVGHDRGKDEVS